MGKSQYELDKARRDRSKKGPGGDERPRVARRNLLIAGAAVAVAALLIFAVVGGGPPEGREANYAAFGLSDDPYLGDPDAPVVLVGYESPHCSACKNFHEAILPQLMASHIETGKAVYYYIQGTIMDDDYRTSVAQECALKYGGREAFWAFTNRLYARENVATNPPIQSWLEDLAGGRGLDADELVTCFNDRETSRAVSKDWAVADDHGVNSTPTFWVFGAQGEAVRVHNFGAVADAIDQMSPVA